MQVIASPIVLTLWRDNKTQFLSLLSLNRTIVQTPNLLNSQKLSKRETLFTIKMEQFENQLHDDLHHFLVSIKEVDERLPECPDVEEKWEEIAKAYIPDGIREFNDFPSASLGWMMYIGMAVAKFWDVKWELYSEMDNLYDFMRDKRGYDSMDEYIREEVLLLSGTDYTRLETIVGECASRVYNALRHQNIEPGTRDAFNAYVACLHQLYLMGVAMQLRRMGYRMTKMN